MSKNSKIIKISWRNIYKIKNKFQNSRLCHAFSNTHKQGSLYQIMTEAKSTELVLNFHDFPPELVFYVSSKKYQK